MEKTIEELIKENDKLRKQKEMLLKQKEMLLSALREEVKNNNDKKGN